MRSDVNMEIVWLFHQERNALRAMNAAEEAEARQLRLRDVKADTALIFIDMTKPGEPSETMTACVSWDG